VYGIDRRVPERVPGRDLVEDVPPVRRTEGDEPPDLGRS
jgi:hypothetical protein